VTFLNKKELAKRTISGVILGPIVVFSFLTYPTLLGLVTAIVMISSFELIEMFTSDLKNPLIKFLITFIVGASTLVYGFALEAESRGILPFEAEGTFFLGFVICIILILINVKEIKYTKRLIESSALSLLYVSFFLSHFYLIQMNYGSGLAIMALTSVWAYDAGAFFIGSKFGKHKLSPHFSPKKSWEGLIGGIAFTFVYLFIFDFIGLLFSVMPKMDILHFFIFALMVGIFDTIGDLMESVIKRYYNVKDSSKILPGHGGMLDRIDGLLIATPMWYLLLAIIGV
jgi:phosphatidate cytidylyltransferase